MTKDGILYDMCMIYVYSGHRMHVCIPVSPWVL